MRWKDDRVIVGILASLSNDDLQNLAVATAEAVIYKDKMLLE